MLMCLRDAPALLLENDTPAKVRVRVLRVALQDVGQQIQGLVEVVGGGFPPGFLGLLGLDAAVVQERDGQIDRAGNPAGRAAVHFTERVDGLTILVLFHVTHALVVGSHHGRQLGGRDLVSQRLQLRRWGLGCSGGRGQPETGQDRALESGKPKGPEDRSPTGTQGRSVHEDPVASSCSWG